MAHPARGAAMGRGGSRFSSDTGIFMLVSPSRQPFRRRWTGGPYADRWVCSSNSSSSRDAKLANGLDLSE